MIKTKNFFEIDGEIYCLENIRSIIKNDNEDIPYLMLYDNDKSMIEVYLTINEYTFIRNLIKKYSNSYTVY